MPHFGGTGRRLRLRKQRRRPRFGSLATTLALLVLGSSAQAATFAVNSLGDAADASPSDNLCLTAEGACTLRAAIQQANATAVADVITFAISGVIVVSDALPDVTQPVTIDATTAPGYVSTPVVAVDGGLGGTGGGAPFWSNGLNLWGPGGSTVRGLAIINFPQKGLDISSEGNTVTHSDIAGNAGTGVWVSRNRNRISLNRIHSNGGLAINLHGGDNCCVGALSYNDRGDADGGGIANDLQNFPVLTAASNGVVSGVLRSASSTSYTIEVFSSPACDPTGFGEAAAVQATTIVTTDANGVASFTVGFPAVEPGTVFSATATGPVGNTSELSQCIAIGRRPVETLTLFNPGNSLASQIGTLSFNPIPHAYYDYVAGLPWSTNPPSKWVMGDWDGDGLETPAAYLDNGAFYYTNDKGRTLNWTGIWFGLLGYPPVAGRFDAAVEHDCLGILHSAPQPPHGEAFAVYFTCDLTSGPDPAKEFQYLGPTLPDSAGFSGEYQFAAGDFDGDGIDTFATRRGLYVSWTDVPPTTMMGAFDKAQYLGAPAAGDSILVSGDWDGDGIASFGLFYPDTVFFRRNDLEWNSGAYERQHVGRPIGTGVTPASWRPGGSAGDF